MLGQPAAEAVAPRARMAVPVAPLYLGVLLLCVTASADRRFSDFKRCADEECSMLLCRGKASQDFTGPDCRFLSFKKGETIYVYYKLSGRRPDLWAGSVGNTFGYFPKDLLNINHIYTEKELEVPAEATDFVCFDTGFDKFETYDVDALLAASALLNRNDDSAAETNHDVENAADELSPSENDHGIKEDLQSLNNDTVDTFESKNDLKEIEGEDPGDFRTEESSQLPSEKETGTLNSKDLRHESEVEKTSESINDKINGVQLTGSTVSDIVEPQKDQATTASSDLQDQTTAASPSLQHHILNKDDVEEQKTFSEANVVPEMKTKFGSTFDAVISDEEDTWNVTSSDDTEDEDEKKEFEKEPNDEMDNLEETPLLSFSEDNNSHTKTRDVSEDSPSTEESDSHIVLTENQENKSVKMDDTVGTLSDTVLATDDREKAMKKEGDEKESQLEMSESNKKAKVENVLPQSSEFNKEPEEMTHMEENSPDDIISDEHSKPNINSPANDMSNINSQKPLLDEIQDQAELKVFKKLDKISNQPELAVPGTNTENTKSLNEHEGGLSVKTVPEQSLEDVSAGDGVKELETETLPAESSHDHPAEQDLDSEEKANVTHTFNFSEQSKLQDEEPLENASEPDVAVSQKVEMREQVDRVKQEITELFTQTLEKETPDYSKEKKMEADELFNSKEDTTIEQDELLEDENAMLSKASKVEHLESHENTDIGQQENANLQNEEVQSNPEFQKRGVFTGSVEIEKESISPSNTDGSTISASEDGEISKDSASSDAKIDFENFDEVVSSSLEPETENTEMNTEELDIQNELPFSDCEKQLILLGSYFKDHDLKRLYKVLGSWNLLRVESMFTDLDQEMRATKLSHVGTSEELEHSLENILETSETSILDVIEKMLDTRDSKDSDVQESDGTFFDEEAVILDDFQELAFQLRQKYSAASESTPLASEDLLNADSDEISAVGEDTLENLTVTTTESAEPTENLEELQNDSLDSNHDTPHHASERSFEEDGGHFNKNKDIQGTFEDSEDIQRSPQAILENTLDMGFGFEVESPSSGTVDSSSISDYHEEEAQGDSSMSGFVGVGSSLILAQEYLGDYAEMVIAALPEEWKPGPTFYGFPWEPVVATAVVGILTVLVFTWRTVLAVSQIAPFLTEKQLAVRIKQLSDEKSDALTKISQLKKKITENEEKVKESEKCASLSQHENKELKKSFKELQKRNEHFTEKIRTLISAMEEEKRKNQEQAGLITKTEKTVEKFNSIINSNKEELSKFQVLLDEARIREDALKAQVMSFEKENTSLKDQKKSLLCDAKNWEEKHRDLGEKIKVLQKSQKELEDTLAHKENEIEILSDCIAELRQLEVCENANLQEHDTQILANGEAVNKKSDAVKIRIKQMMDVSRVKATLSFVEEERNTYLAKLLAEEKQRHELEEQVKKMEHDRASLNSEKCHLENQFKTIQQKLEIMNEMYQQKENALQQKLTQEKFERLEKENKLSEVDGKALQAEEELKACKRRIQEIEEELQKTERSYKAQIAAHEKKAHENWLNARASERALVEEKRETANLRQKLVEVNDKLAELQRPLFKPTPAHSDRQMQPLRRDDSYGPSPVSGGAPSPPLMIEGPGRSPSAPLGRRNESFGPRPPSDPHGRYSDLRHPLPARPDVYVPRTSSPSTLDGSQSAAVESETQRSAESSSQITEAISSKSQGHPSFLESPIRDVSGPGPSPQPKGHGPLPPNGPPPAVLRPPNGLPPLIPPVPPHPAMGPGPGRFGPTGPPRLYGSVPPPYVRGPLPPPRGYPVGPPAPFGPRDFLPEIRNPMAGPREYPLPSRPLPPGSNPPAAGRDYPGPPPQNVLVATRDFPEGPHPSPAISRDYSPQQGPSRDTSTTSHTEP
ncbi:melanoma inhibitory activity protein 3 isoform X1 [Arapaima gigas]